MKHIPDDNLLDHIDFAFLEDGERRINEVAIATKFKGQELMNLFNQAHLAAQKARSALHGRVAELEQEAETLAALISLVRAPAKLKELGVLSARSPGGSEDQRQAVIAMDPEYLALRERILNLKAGVEDYTIRARGMERAFSAVKAIYMDRDLPNPNLGNPVARSAPVSSNKAVEEIISGPAKPTGGFGKPAYRDQNY